MNTQTLKGSWNITKGKLKQKYAQLTDNDLTYIDGKEDEMIGRIQKKIGVSRDELEKFIDQAATADAKAVENSKRAPDVDVPLTRVPPKPGYKV